MSKNTQTLCSNTDRQTNTRVANSAWKLVAPFLEPGVADVDAPVPLADPVGLVPPVLVATAIGSELTTPHEALALADVEFGLKRRYETVPEDDSCTSADVEAKYVAAASLMVGPTNVCVVFV